MVAFMFFKQPQNHIQVLNKESGFPLSWILETPDNQQLFRLNQSKWVCFSSEPWSCLESCLGYLCKKMLPQGSISAWASLFHRGKMKINYMGLKLSSHIRLVNLKKFHSTFSSAEVNLGSQQGSSRLAVFMLLQQGAECYRKSFRFIFYKKQTWKQRACPVI